MRVRTVVVAAVAGLGVASGSAQEATREEATGEIAAEGQVDVFSFKVGDCFDSGDVQGAAGNTQVDAVKGKPCTEPHYGEVFHLENAEAAAFPGETELQAMSEEICTANFESYVGTPYADSTLYMTGLWPTAESWKNGDREIVCVLIGDDAPLVGSQKGAGI